MKSRTLWIATSIWACSLLGWLADIAWPFELFTHFRLQYCLLLLAISAALFRQRQTIAATLSLLMTLANALPLWPYLSAEATPPDANHPTLRLLSYNLGHRNYQLDRVLNYLDGQQNDIVLLLELTPKHLALLQPVVQHYPEQVLAERTDGFGLGLFSRLPLHNSSVHHWPGFPVPYIETTINWAGQSTTLLGVHLYAPLYGAGSRGRNQQLQDLTKHIQALPASPVILLGDLNVTPYSPHFKRLLANTGLQDSSLGHGLAASWPAYLGPLGIPIDHCLLSPGFQVAMRTERPYLGSDHLPLQIALQRSSSVP